MLSESVDPERRQEQRPHKIEGNQGEKGTKNRGPNFPVSLPFVNAPFVIPMVFSKITGEKIKPAAENQQDKMADETIQRIKRSDAPADPRRLITQTVIHRLAQDADERKNEEQSAIDLGSFNALRLIQRMSQKMKSEKVINAVGEEEAKRKGAGEIPKRDAGGTRPEIHQQIKN